MLRSNLTEWSLRVHSTGMISGVEVSQSREGEGTGGAEEATQKLKKEEEFVVKNLSIIVCVVELFRLCT